MYSQHHDPLVSHRRVLPEGSKSQQRTVALEDPCEQSGRRPIGPRNRWVELDDTLFTQPVACDDVANSKHLAGRKHLTHASQRYPAPPFNSAEHSDGVTRQVLETNRKAPIAKSCAGQSHTQQDIYIVRSCCNRMFRPLLLVILLLKSRDQAVSRTGDAQHAHMSREK